MIGTALQSAGARPIRARTMQKLDAMMALTPKVSPGRGAHVPTVIRRSAISVPRGSRRVTVAAMLKPWHVLPGCYRFAMLVVAAVGERAAGGHHG
jgi:hypothetical protein